MKCLILAAGYATRLYPLTENFPKPLLKVGRKTILDWLVDDLIQWGVRDFVVISNHRYYDHFTAWARKKDVPVQVLDDGSDCNENRLGAVKDLQFALQQLEICEDVLVIAGDNVLDFSLGNLLDYAMRKGASCVMRYWEADRNRLLKSGVVTVDEADRVLAMTEKSPQPATQWCCPPFYYYTSGDARQVAAAIQDGCGTDAPGSFLAWLCRKSPVYAMEMPGKRYDIGDPDSYARVQKEYEGLC